MTLLRAPQKVTNAYEETLQRLLQSIRLGLIEPGSQLPAERELAALMNVSRDVLRDVLKTLGEAGYITVKRGRYGGTFVVEELPRAGLADPLLSKVDETQMRETLALRRILEVGAAREAANTKLSAAQVTTLKASLARCSAASLTDYRRLDSRLHLLIAELTGSKRLVEMVAEVRGKTNALLDAFPKLEPNITHSSKQHEQIVAAIVAGEAETAAALMLEHLRGSEALMHAFLSTYIDLPEGPAAGQEGAS